THQADVGGDRVGRTNHPGLVATFFAAVIDVLEVLVDAIDAEQLGLGSEGVGSTEAAALEVSTLRSGSSTDRHSSAGILVDFKTATGAICSFVVALRVSCGQLQATQLVVTAEAVHAQILIDLAVLLAFQSVASVQGETTPARRLVVSSLAV